MMIVSFVSVKGGSGKTTLAVSFAGWLVDQGYSVGFLDADFQKLGSLWLSKAEPKVDVRQATTPAAVERELKSLSAKCEFVVADGPGGLDKQNVILIKRADLCVIPVMASPLDIHSAFSGAKQLVDAVSRRHAGTRTVRFVINGVDDRTAFSREIRKFARRLDPPATTSCVRRLSALVKAANLVAPEIPTRLTYADAARADLEVLFSELMTCENLKTSKRAGNE